MHLEFSDVLDAKGLKVKLCSGEWIANSIKSLIKSDKSIGKLKTNIFFVIICLRKLNAGKRENIICDVMDGKGLKSKICVANFLHELRMPLFRSKTRFNNVEETRIKLPAQWYQSFVYRSDDICSVNIQSPLTYL